MKTAITVASREEAQSVQLAMADPMTRALVLTMGALLQLPSDRARLRVLHYVADKLNDDADQAGAQATP